METQKNIYRFIKIEGHPNWFLALERNQKEPTDFSETMQEKILRSEVCKLHHDTPQNRLGFTHRVKMAAIATLDYESLANKYGTILIRPIGSFMTLLNSHKITDEVFDEHFPIDDFADIVICENDSEAEDNWVDYLQKRFPKRKIVTINYFDLRSESEVEKYFNKAKYITFSTTFSNFEWFKKLSKYATNKQTIIGYCHNQEKWDEALSINKDIEVIKKIK